MKRRSLKAIVGLCAVAGSLVAASASAQDGRYDPANPLNPKAEKPKRWGIDTAFETHRLIRQNDLGGAARNKWANFIYLIAKYDITDNDRVSLRWGLEQHAVADSGETGWRADDLSTIYTHKFVLPQAVNLRTSLGVTFPTSFYSKLAGMTLATRLGLSVSRQFGDLLVLAAARGERFWMRYDTAVGGSPNAKYLLGGALSLEYTFPFHKALSAGTLLSTFYYWLYPVQSASPAPYGTVADDRYGQRVNQAYGGEIFARYTFPDFKGVHADMLLAFAMGDGSLGYTSTIHDGVRHTYLFWRRNSEIYGALSLSF